MSLMEFREPNQVLWYGSRPAHRGTQVAVSDIVTNDTSIIHTVSAGKSLFISSIVLGLLLGGASNTCRIYVRNVLDVEQYTIFRITPGAAGALSVPISFNPPLEIPTGYDVVHTTNADFLTMYSFIHGWEE